MRKLSSTLLLAFFPMLIMADTPLSFSPPPGDVSVMFLGNLFGLVDGVLHSSGSQIMGSMFAVFNAAVLALGGIVITYTIVVSTMNTAHEGQMLGQKWSSIWVPIRSTIGLALLIPKASGYCLMQIFIMWVVIQGVGAADKVWNAALNYLNRGGVIIQAQMNTSLGSLTPESTVIAQAASIMLSSETCMLALQNLLTKEREFDMDPKSGICDAALPGSKMRAFCDTPVPDFLNTVNFVSIQNQQKTPGNLSKSPVKPIIDIFNPNGKAQPNPPTPPPTPVIQEVQYRAPMPYFDPTSTSVYSSLEGICGKLIWAPFSINIDIPGLDLETLQLARAIALQQMYTDLSTLARTMVDNDPELNPTTTKPLYQFSQVAVNQFGIPYLTTGTPCIGLSDGCRSWGSAPPITTGPIFMGTEFQGALADYNGVMAPSLNLLEQAKDHSNAMKTREFINLAESRGWMMAGSYFFDLINLNGSAAASTNIDSNTGLDNSSFSSLPIEGAFTNCNTAGDNCSCEDTNQYGILCTMFSGNSKKVSPINNLISGAYLEAPIPAATMTPQMPAVGGLGSATVNALVTNSMVVSFSENIAKPSFYQMNFIHKISLNDAKWPKAKFKKCSSHWDIPCEMAHVIGDFFYNIILVGTWNGILKSVLEPMINITFNLVIMEPLRAIGKLFVHGMREITDPYRNPIVSLANMGTYYINLAMNTWIDIMLIAIVCALLPFGLGGWIYAFILMVFPIVFSWLGIMMSIGFLTAYYIPFVPYMTFTFGTIAWLMAVIEAMVAGPIVALGVAHPEGHEAFGKGEQAIMILMNVFLRPAMMVMGYIGSISLSYIGVWIINQGFSHVLINIQKGSKGTSFADWAELFAFFFGMILYTMLYLMVVEQAFNLIYILPDKVLRWIGGQPEGIGAETARWGEATKGKVTEAGKATEGGAGSMQKQLGAYAAKAASTETGGAEVTAKGTSTPSTPESS